MESDFNKTIRLFSFKKRKRKKERHPKENSPYEVRGSGLALGFQVRTQTEGGWAAYLIEVPQTKATYTEAMLWG